MSGQRYSTGEQWIAKRDLLRKIMDATEYERASAFVDGLANALAEAEAERDYLRQACAWMDDPAKEIAEMRER